MNYQQNAEDAKRYRPKVIWHILNSYDRKTAERTVVYKNFKHIYSKHLNVAEDTMLIKFKKTNVRAVTTFISDKRRIAEMIVECLMTHIDEICEYVADEEDTEFFYIEESLPDDVAGCGFKRGMEGIQSMNKYVIILGKDGKTPFYLRNAYPVVDYLDVTDF